MAVDITCTRSIRILEIQMPDRRDDHIRFSREPDEPGDIPMVVHLERDAWRDMGRPKAITVTVEPGDLLNQ